MLPRLIAFFLSFLIHPIAKLPPPPVYVPEPLTLDRIFSPDHSWTATLSAQTKTTLLTTGDILLARTINSTAVSKNNFTFPFQATKDLLSSADISFTNLETPLTSDCRVKTEGTVFCGSTRWTEGLKESGLDVITISNNHSTDARPEGFFETGKLLTDSGFTVAGYSGPVYKESRGVRFAFLAYNEVCCPTDDISWAKEEKIKNEIVLAKQNADIVIVMFHWGNEYTYTITPRQKTLAHMSIDLGADAVLSNHPHWVQPLEIYNSKPIIYSHGNFIFDQYWSQRTRRGIVSRLTFYNKSLVDIELIPVVIDTTGQPTLLKDDLSDQILKEIRPLSVE